MTQEQKEVLLKDLSARLPYGVKVVCETEKYIFEVEVITSYSCVCPKDKKGLYNIDVDEIKPYLFPLSSMTEEQKKELFKFCEFYIQENGEGKNEEVYGIEIARRPDPVYCYDHTFRIWGIDMRAIDWFLKNHFDIYGLIPMG